jgi:acylphosphatase
VAKRLLVTGVVQGVGYRQWVVSEARRHGLTGWVRNRRDGSVEAVVAGAAEAVAQLIEAARRGPPAARVEHVQVEDAEGEFSGFDWRPTA